MHEHAAGDKHREQVDDDGEQRTPAGWRPCVMAWLRAGVGRAWAALGRR